MQLRYVAKLKDFECVGAIIGLYSEDIAQA